tara:strand:+ start:4062 stop:4583 length:522 start_codon:yes stop_codon:yes gene_type:complete
VTDIIKHRNNFNWGITKRKEFKVSREKLWNVISSPSNLDLFHPFCLKNKTIKWPGLGSVDQIYYYSGLTLEREFINWLDNRGYDLFIGKKGGQKSLVSWRIKEKNESLSLSITVYPYLKNKGSKITNFIPFFVVIKPSLSNYLDSVLSGLEYYITTNKKVEKNQFGTHKVFSN